MSKYIALRYVHKIKAIYFYGHIFNEYILSELYNVVTLQVNTAAKFFSTIEFDGMSMVEYTRFSKAFYLFCAIYFVNIHFSRCLELNLRTSFGQNSCYTVYGRYKMLLKYKMSLHIFKLTRMHFIIS